MAWGSDEALAPPEETRPPGWCELGMEYTLAEPQRDPEVTKAIEALDPTFTPIGIRWVFLAPADAQTSVRQRHVFLYHGIGRTNLMLNTKGWGAVEAEASMQMLKLPSFEIPPSYSGRIPKYLDPTVGILDEPGFLGLETIFPSPATKHGAVDLPGPFVPWDWALVAALKRCYTSQHSVKDLKEKALFAPERKRNEKRRKDLADFAYGFGDFQNWAQKKIATASDEEIVREMARVGEASRAARLRRMAAAVNFKLHGVS